MAKTATKLKVKAKVRGAGAVMASRREPPKSLDFFPTPPFATRALCEFCLAPHRIGTATVWEPAAGEGHMAEVLKEYFMHVHATDVHDYGRGYGVGSFTGVGLDVAEYTGPGSRPHWIITNPPFNLALEFLDRAFAEAAVGVALLVRTQWLEGAERWDQIFRDRPPTHIHQFVERVPMQRGSWNPEGSTATAYVWVIWEKANRSGKTLFDWIPPGQREALTKPGDVLRFGMKDPNQQSLFDEEIVA